MGHIVRLQTGDKRSPTRQLLLSDGTSDGHIYLRLGGFSPGPGALNMQMSGQTIRADGQERVASSRNNIQMSVVYDLRGDTYAELNYLQAQIAQYQTEARLYHEKRIGERVFVYYRWSTPAMDDIPVPAWGQFGYFFEVISIEATWPDNLHTGQLVSGNIESVTLDLTCKPYAEGLEQWAFNADGIPDDDADVELTYDLSSNEFDGDFTICGWIEHRESDYYAFEAYQDAADYINVLWDESDSRYELNSRVASSTTTTNGSSQSLSAGDLVHICVVGNSGGNDAWYINGSVQTAGSASQDWGSVEFTLASATSAGGVTGNTNELDAWRIFDDALTAAEVLALYNDELPIKSQTRGNKLISPPVWLKTRSGDGTFENVDGVISASAKDNWGVVGGVPGDVEATVRWQIDPGSTTPEHTYYFGRKASQSTFTPSGVLWHDYSGTADSGNSSGDAYEQLSANGEIDFDATFSGTPLTGQYNFLGRFRSANGQRLHPYYMLGSDATNTMVRGDRVTIADNASMLFHDFGRMYLDFDNLQSGGDVKVGLISQVDNDFPMRGLQNYWLLDEASGTRVNSFGGTNLTASGTVNSRSGKINNAPDFTTANRLYITDPASMEFSGSFTISFWALVDATGSTYGLVTKWDSTATNTLEWNIQFNGTNFAFQMSSDDSTSTVVTDANTVSTATWYFIVAKFNARTNTMYLRVDDNDPVTDTHLGGLYQSGNSNFTVGAFHTGSLGLNGGVDELSVWTRYLTQDEESILYNSGSGLALPTGGVAQLDFIQLLPEPSFKVEPLTPESISIAATDYIEIKDRSAYLVDTSGNHVYSYSFEGDEVTVIPEHYNYVFLLNGQLARDYPISATNDVSAWITPRYLLVGG